jgi:hypothetical protein
MVAQTLIESIVTLNRKLILPLQEVAAGEYGIQL